MWALVFNGKLETEKRNEFIEGFNKLVQDTNSVFFGRIEQYQFAEYVDCQTAEVSDVKPNTEDNGTETERT